MRGMPPATTPLAAWHRHSVCACAHLQTCTFVPTCLCAYTSTCVSVCTRVHVLPCVRTPTCMGGHPGVSPDQGPSVFVLCRPCPSCFLCTWPGPCLPALCLPMCVACVMARALWWVEPTPQGPVCLPWMLAPPAFHWWRRGVGRGCCWVPPHPTLQPVCAPAHLPPSLPASKP